MPLSSELRHRLNDFLHSVGDWLYSWSENHLMVFLFGLIATIGLLNVLFNIILP